MEIVHSFCYLGDVISDEGGVEKAVIAQIKIAWNKFRELKCVLTAKDIAKDIKGHVYSACVRSCMAYASET